jgi:serine/threonine-protein kinase PpkA
MALTIPGFRVVRKLNQGGMATVYLAIQVSVGRPVALKIMSPQLSIDPSFGERFQREATIVGQLSHPHIVSIYDIGRVDNVHYIAMDYLPGGTLHELITSGLDEATALRVLKEIAGALDYAHEKGYVHRDIKPENILFRSDQSAVLTDFGVARAAHTTGRMTQVGTMIGTPHYMSPEQAKGKTVDGRSDLYSLGIVFYEMLTGTLPFNAEETVAIALQHISAPIPRLPSHLKHCQGILDNLLAKQPDQRFQRGRDLILAVDALVLKRRQQTTGIPPAAAAQQYWEKTHQYISSRITPLISKVFAHHGADTATSSVSGADLPTVISTTPLWQLNRLAIVTAQVKARPLRSACLATGVVVSIAAASLFISTPSTDAQPETPGWLSGDTVSNTDETELPLVKLTPSETVDKNSSDTHFSLVVSPTPKDARVRILNIPERYETNMTLPSGRYHIEVTHPDFVPFKEWIDIADADLHLPVTLIAMPEGNNELASQELANGAPLPTMVVLPAGSFTMGSRQDSTAMPLRSVTIPSAFAISKFEVTFDEYDAFARATGRRLPSDNRWGRGKRPVVNVTHEDARAYTTWLSEQTGKRYRLPSEAEWEYAARATTTTDYWWGNNMRQAANRANCRRDCRSQYSGLVGGKTAPVGSYQANHFGLHDMAGNVAEWVADCYIAHYKQHPLNAKPYSTNRCSSYAVRGGGANQTIERLTSYARDYHHQDIFDKFLGFRVVMEL